MAHTLGDAEAFFERKLKFAYDRLPEEIKTHEAFKLVSDSKKRLKFANNSSVSVGTSLRGGTYNLLHVSEYGKLCADSPQKAAEVASGALNTVALGNFIFIESTAAGAFGDFYKRSMKAEQLYHRHEAGMHDYSPLDYRFHFYPWWKNPEYQTKYSQNITDEYERYFNLLKEEHSISITPEQKYWYVHTAEDQEEEMKKEYPSFPSEAFEQVLEGAIFGRQMEKLEYGEHIVDLPFVPGIPVNTFWDLGAGDATAVWFHQRVNQWDNFINYYENSNEDLMHYIRMMQECRQTHGYMFGTCYLPHDGASKNIIGVAGSAEDIFRHHNFTVEIVPRVLAKKVSIDSTRRAFSHIKFDANKCEMGVKALRNYRWQIDKKSGEYKPKPAHNWASHAADALQVYGQYLIENGEYAFAARLPRSLVGDAAAMSGGIRPHTRASAALDHDRRSAGGWIV